MYKFFANKLEDGIFFMNDRKKQDSYDLAFFPYLELTPHFSMLPNSFKKDFFIFLIIYLL